MSANKNLTAANDPSPKSDRRQRLKFLRIKASESSEKADEGWLLSYSDLMTLMFGFFVILYALSFEKREDYTGWVKSLAIGLKDKAGGTGEIIDSQDKVADRGLGEKPQQLGSESGTKAIEALTTQIKGLLDDKKNSENEKLALASQVAQLESLLLEKNKPTGQEQVDSQKTKANALSVDIEKLKKQLGNREKLLGESKNLVSQMQVKQESLEEKIQTLNSELEKIRKESPAMQETSGQGSNFSYLSVLTYWSTKNHDVDLSIETPEGVRFNFKKTKSPGSKGEFILDSRNGPGAEIWHTPDAVTGIYKMRVSLYSQYGNPSPAIVQGRLSTVKGVINLPKIELNGKKRTELVKFRVNYEAKIEIVQ